MGLFRKKKISFIENAGGVIITKSIYQGTSKLKWFFKEKSVNSSDNGWRAIGDNDTQEYLDNPENSMVVDFNTLANIEPAVLFVYDMPIGTDLEFCRDHTGKYFIDANTGNRIKSNWQFSVYRTDKIHLGNKGRTSILSIESSASLVASFSVSRRTAWPRVLRHFAPYAEYDMNK